MWKTKAQTVKLMEKFDALWWYNSTTTGYNGLPPCQKCPACELRAKGFEEAEIPDPLLFEWECEYLEALEERQNVEHEYD